MSFIFLLIVGLIVWNILLSSKINNLKKLILQDKPKKLYEEEGLDEEGNFILKKEETLQEIEEESPPAGFQKKKDLARGFIA
jgi:hypothetical protein